jgi:hypothetical protein
VLHALNIFATDSRGRSTDPARYISQPWQSSARVATHIAFWRRYSTFATSMRSRRARRSRCLIDFRNRVCCESDSSTANVLQSPGGLLDIGAIEVPTTTGAVAWLATQNCYEPLVLSRNPNHHIHCVGMMWMMACSHGRGARRTFVHHPFRIYMQETSMSLCCPNTHFIHSSCHSL